MKRVIMFSGQGSQAEGMGVSLAGNSAKAKEVFDTASQILGFDLLDKCANAPAEELAKTVIAQPAIMAVSLAGACALLEKGIEATAAVGHSLGEYATLVYTGIVSLEDGFRRHLAHGCCDGGVPLVEHCVAKHYCHAWHQEPPHCQRANTYY